MIIFDDLLFQLKGGDFVVTLACVNVCLVRFKKTNNLFEIINMMNERISGKIYRNI